MNYQPRFGIERDVQDRDLGFLAFLKMLPDELVNFKAKITYIGEQRKALPTIVVGSKESVGDTPWADADKIMSMRVAGIDFANDDLAPIFCRAAAGQLLALIQNVAAIPTVANAASAAKYDGTFYGKYLAISIFNEIDGEESRAQAVLGQADAVPLLDAFGRALAEEPECRDALYILWRGLGFHIGVLDPDSDGDGASDGREASWGTNPNDPDSDADGLGDAQAILSGRDPLNPVPPAVTPRIASITEGPFAGSRVVDLTTSPDLLNGQATIELKFTPKGYLPPTDNLVILQIFRRTAVKADGFTIPLLPSLYIEYAGSPELDLHTLDGATVDHKVGELDPYYNGRDPQDQFIGAADRQHPGHVRGSDIRPSAILYRCRTYEEHWRALNPEGVREVRFSYEAAVFCENGEGRGAFLGNLKWAWGKRRSEPVQAWIESFHAANSAPTGTLVVEGDKAAETLKLALTTDDGQPSAFFSDVLSLWLKNHKFAWPGRELSLDNHVRLVVPQPISVSGKLKVKTLERPPVDEGLAARGLRLVGFAREISGVDEAGHNVPPGYFPFELPLQLEFQYRSAGVQVADPRRVGVVRWDQAARSYSANDLYVLEKNAQSGTVVFGATSFGTYALVEKA
ncbi:MAG: hypothetical protein EOR51_29980 [Mesorhizobium sp.]|nr:MAG: hypothetical protein EOR51_29980 [Mesorhizobium sp.]